MQKNLENRLSRWPIKRGGSRFSSFPFFRGKKYSEAQATKINRKLPFPSPLPPPSFPFALVKNCQWRIVPCFTSPFAAAAAACHVRL